MQHQHWCVLEGPSPPPPPPNPTMPPAPSGFIGNPLVAACELACPTTLAAVLPSPSGLHCPGHPDGAARAAVRWGARVTPERYHHRRHQCGHEPASGLLVRGVHGHRVSHGGTLWLLLWTLWLHPALCRGGGGKDSARWLLVRVPCVSVVCSCVTQRLGAALVHCRHDGVMCLWERAPAAGVVVAYVCCPRRCPACAMLPLLPAPALAGDHGD